MWCRSFDPRVAEFDLLQVQLARDFVLFLPKELMNSLCSFFRKASFIAVVFLFPLAALAGKNKLTDAARQLEALATHESGVLSDLPEEIRSLRSGPVSQKITVSDDGILTLSRSFSCSPFMRENSGGTVIATSVKQVALGNLRQSTALRVVMNRHVNAIQFTDEDGQWPLGFLTTSETEKGFALLEALMATAPPVAAPQSFSPATAAAKAGFTYLAVSFRCKEVGEGVQLLSMTEPSPHLLCWLTKKTRKEIEEICFESMDRLPVFLFDLSVLDGPSFFTHSIPGASSFFPCSIGSQVVQSVHSSDSKGLERCLHCSPYIGICCTTMPRFTSPVAVIGRAHDVRTVRKEAKARPFFDIERTQWLSPSQPREDHQIDRGQRISWLTGMNDGSEDILRHCLLYRPLTPALFAYTLYYEFPKLRKLVRSKSLHSKELSIEDVMCRTSQALEQYERRMSPAGLKVVRLALATHELGAPFGGSEQCGYNSWPLSLAIAERVGFSEQEKRALRALVESSVREGGQKSEKKKKGSVVLGSLLLEARCAGEIGICLQEWLQMKSCFYSILSSQEKSAGTSQAVLRTLIGIQQMYRALLPFGLPLGTTATQGGLETTSLSSSYLWEARDPRHRNGRVLRSLREKYENMLLDGVKTNWKGRFWQWVDRETKEEALDTGLSLNEEQRKAYAARCQRGLLVSSSFPLSEEQKEALFVIDGRGTIYLAPKGGNGSPISHALLAAWKPVAASGLLVIKNGRPISLSDRCSSYCCGQRGMAVTVQILEKMGVDISGLSSGGAS